MPAPKLVMTEKRRDLQPGLARQDHLGHRRHADRVGAERAAARISAGVSKLGPENHM